jgi:predicted anti-sigma-YlaC factor YlaD
MNASQPDHPDVLRLQAYLDGTVSHDEAEALAQHLEGCSECAKYVARVRSLAEALRELPTSARMVPPMKDRIASRIAVRPRGESWLAGSTLKAAAAAAVIFGAGVAAGIAAGTRGSPGESPPPPTDLRPALDVQQAGTSYIAALARLNASTGGDDARVVYGREVALATLYGAAAEAVGPLGADPAASELLTLTRTVRERVARSSSTERLP